jgi:hypothetical protein
MVNLEKISSDWEMDPTNRKCTIECLNALTEMLVEQKQSAEDQIASINMALVLIEKWEARLLKENMKK